MLATAYAICLTLTAYTLNVILPINKRLIKLADELKIAPNDEKLIKEFRELQRRWRTRNYGEVRAQRMSALN